jgi:hypothetical protein
MTFCCEWGCSGCLRECTPANLFDALLLPVVVFIVFVIFYLLISRYLESGENGEERK